MITFPCGGKRTRAEIEEAFEHYSYARRMNCWSQVRRVLPTAELEAIQDWAGLEGRQAMPPALRDEEYFYPYALMVHVALTRGGGCEPEYLVHEVCHHGSARGILLPA